MFAFTAAGITPAALVLSLVEWIFRRRRQDIAMQAHHCAIPAFLFTFAAIFFGFTYWQYLYHRALLKYHQVLCSKDRADRLIL